MSRVIVFDMQDRFQGRELLEYLEAHITEWNVDLRNCVNGQDGNFKQLRIYNKPKEGEKQILIAELDIRFPGMIRVPDENWEVVEKLRNILKDYFSPVLILTNCSKGRRAYDIG